MLQIVTPEEMAEMDRYAIETLKIPGEDLMENAAEAVVRALEKTFGAFSGLRVLALCGKGKNGGDGMAVARIMSKRGAKVTIELVADPEKLTGENRLNYDRAVTNGIPFVESTDSYEAYDIVLDGLFGTGFTGKLDSPYREICHRVNESARYVMAIDIPSGLNGLTGIPEKDTIKADETVTFALPKVGLLCDLAADVVGKLTVSEIGFPKRMMEEVETKERAFGAKDVLSLKRSRNVNKGNFGNVLIIAGSEGMSGAAVLSARGALRMGAGKVTVACPGCIEPIVAGAVIEAMTVSLPDKNGVLSPKAAEYIETLLPSFDAVLIGPGLRTGEGTLKAVEMVLNRAGCPIVLDADALNVLDGHLDWLDHANGVLTPHPGEMARLLGKTPMVIQENRLKYARELATTHNVTVVLKGVHTVTAQADEKAVINLSGNAGMASGGMGDVLGGMIAALLGQGISKEEAVPSAVYLHGAAGDKASLKYGETALTASDLLEALAEVTRQYE